MVYVLKKRLEHTTNFMEGLKAIKTLYGVEIMADNVAECRQRLYDTITDKYPEIKDTPLYNNGLRTLLKNRIKWCDSLKVDYDHWERIPKVQENVSFVEKTTNNNEKYPMWADHQLIQLTLF